MNSNIKVLLISVLFVISACTSSSKSTDVEIPNPDPSVDGDSVGRITSLYESIDSLEGAVNIGWFEIDEVAQIPLVDSRAVFFELGGDNPEFNPVANFLKIPGDTCVVESRNPGPESMVIVSTDYYRTISVGEVITMFEVGAEYKYSELAHLGLATEGSYINYLDLPYPSPVSLNISATGEAFSAFSLTVEKPASLEGLSISNGQRISSGATITWSASADTDTMLNLSLEESSNNVASFVINCRLIDDGQFTLPANLEIPEMREPYCKQLQGSE